MYEAKPLDRSVLAAVGRALLHRDFISRGGYGGGYYYRNPNPHGYVAPYRRYQIPTYTHPRYGLTLAQPKSRSYYV